MIIVAVRSQLKTNSHKYSIKVPRDCSHAKQLDKKNENRLWEDAHDKEIYNVSVTFEILENGKKVPVGWTKTSGHLIWDLKMGFIRITR